MHVDMAHHTQGRCVFCGTTSVLLFDVTMKENLCHGRGPHSYY